LLRRLLNARCDRARKPFTDTISQECTFVGVSLGHVTQQKKGAATGDAGARGVGRRHAQRVRPVIKA
jgi:hypothetical protein